MVSFLSPLFLLGALAAAVPIVLHLLKREPEMRLKFSAVKLLRRAPVEHTRRRHLNELLLLLLRVAALVLLAVAFARPFFASGAASGAATLTVVALDTSLSLSAPGQLEKAREQAKAAIASTDSDLVAVVTFADAAEVALRPSADRGLAQSAIDDARAGYGGTRFRPAINAANELFDGRRGTLIVVTDMQATGWRPGDEAVLPAQVRLEVSDVGAPPPNFAVTGARKSGERIIALIRNGAGDARDARVGLTVDGRPAGEAIVAVDAGQTSEVAIPGTAGREAIVAVDDPAGAAGDNAWHLVLDETARPTVLVVTATGDLERDAYYLRRAIGAAGGGGATYQVEGVAAERLSSMDRLQVQRHTAVVLTSTRGLESRGRELLTAYVRGGGGLLMAAGPTVDPQVASQLLGGTLTMTQPDVARGAASRSLAPGDLRHPVFERFRARSAPLGLVTFRRLAALSGDGCQTLARFTTGETALADCNAGDGRMVVLASDLNNAWNDFPLHATFVPFIHEVVRYLRGTRRSRGEYLVADVPADVPGRPGFVDVKEAGSVLRAAVNVDPLESIPERLSIAEFETAVSRGPERPESGEGVAARQQEERQRVWQYVLGLMVAMLAVESFVGSRTS